MFKFLGTVAGVVAAIIICAIVWKANFFLLPLAGIQEDGGTARGHVYANSYRAGRVTHLVITRVEAGRQHSYLAWIEHDSAHGAPVVSDCENWTTPPLPLFMFPDVNPPCIKWYAAEDVPPQATTPKRDVKVQGRSIEFTANEGKRVTVHW